MECVVTIQVFVSSGLGGMSGAQPKAAAICGCIGVVAEVGPYLLWISYDEIDFSIRIVSIWILIQKISRGL